jgi:hypothetical protein
MTIKIILLGQGWRFTSQGMVMLGGRLGENTFIYGWDSPEVIIKILWALSRGHKVVVIGYSLGANQLGFISAHIKDMIDLGVAYDPSRYSPLTFEDKYGDHYQTAPNFKRFLCYQNTGAWFFGGSYYVGKNVELTRVFDFHLGIQFNETLHQKTIAAVGELGD